MTTPKISQGMRLYSRRGQRLYLNPAERAAFMAAAQKLPPLQKTFCLMLAFTGCRLSEARALRHCDVQLEDHCVAIQSLKRRSKDIIREVPIPAHYVQLLRRTHLLDWTACDQLLWGKSACLLPRITAYRWVKEGMQKGRVNGPQACPKGLRHGFGIHAVRCGVQLHMLSKWMGHAHLETTAIYATALGPEEREIARRMWA